VQAHNETSLSAEVAGKIARISPSFEVGAFFAAGDTLVELDARDYETALLIAESDLASAKAALTLAQQDHDRIIDLFENDNIGTQADVDAVIAELAQAEAQLESSEAELAQAKRDLERTTVHAPFDGRVRAKMVGVGQQINSGTPLGVVFAVDYSEVRLPIGADELQYLTLPEMEGDAPVPVVLRNAITEEDETEWHGQIVRTEGTLDADSLELFAIARINDPFGLTSGEPPLRVGQPVEASIVGDTLAGVYAVPRSAVRQLDRIYLLKQPEMTLMAKTIEPIWSDENYVIIRDDSIEEGALVCLTHFVFAPEGAPVEIIPDIDPDAETERRSRTVANGIDS
jgi:membrane fusion protein, multidrug efflux system